MASGRRPLPSRMFLQVLSHFSFIRNPAKGPAVRQRPAPAGFVPAQGFLRSRAVIGYTAVVIHRWFAEIVRSALGR